MIKKRKFTRWRQNIDKQHKTLDFERQPILKWGRTTKTYTHENKGKITKAVVVLDSKLKKHPKLIEVVAKHELRENLAFQNYASQRQAHQFALKHEKQDLKKLNLKPKEYRKLTRKSGYKP